MNNQFTTRTLERGQGLAEYALIIVLVGVVVIVVLALTGTSVRDVYCDIVTELTDAEPDTCVAASVDDDSSDDEDEDTDTVAITTSSYDSGDQEAHIHATSDGGTDSGVTLTASPGGTLSNHSSHGHYHIRFSLSGCPCVVTVTSSEGGSASTTVGP